MIYKALNYYSSKANNKDQEVEEIYRSRGSAVIESIPCLSCERPGFDPWLLPLRPLSKALTYTCFWGHIAMVPQLT